MDAAAPEDVNDIFAGNIFKRFDKLRQQGMSEQDALLVIWESAYSTGHMDGFEVGYSSAFGPGYQNGRTSRDLELQRAAQAQLAQMSSQYREQNTSGDDSGIKEYQGGEGQYL